MVNATTILTSQVCINPKTVIYYSITKIEEFLAHENIVYYVTSIQPRASSCAVEISDGISRLSNVIVDHKIPEFIIIKNVTDELEKVGQDCEKIWIIGSQKRLKITK